MKDNTVTNEGYYHRTFEHRVLIIKTHDKF